MSFTDSSPSVTCSTATIDPASWVTVTFHGTIGGQPVSITVDYNSTTHATANISGYTTATGPIPYTLGATGHFGPYGTYESLVATGTLDCHAAPTTTTTEPTTTTLPVTTTTECQDHTLACAGPPVTDHRPAPHPVHNINIGTAITTVPASPPALPYTGGNNGQLVVGGGGLVLLGATLLAIVKHRRSLWR